MLPLLIVLGATGAVLEVKRLMSRAPKDGDMFRLQQSEEKLKRVLQVSRWIAGWTWQAQCPSKRRTLDED